MPAQWNEQDLNELHDPIMKQEAIDELEEMREEFENVLKVARANSDCLDLASFTFENYRWAHY